MSRGYGTVAEYRDDPSQVYRDDPSGYQDSRNAGNFDRIHDQLSSSIFQINTNTTSLERLMNQVGTKNDNAKLRERLHEQQQKTNKVIAQTAKTLKDTQSMRQASSQQKIKLTRLNGQFKETVERYNNIQKDVATKIRSSKPVSSGHKTEQLIDFSSDVGWSDTDVDRQKFLEQEERRQAQLQAQDEQIAIDVELAQEREEQIRQLEGDILDINVIFKDLANLVYEQGETIDSIEGNVTRAADDVVEGNQQLQQASNYQKKYRKKLCIFVVILVVIVAIIGIIIATQVGGKK